MHPEESLGRRYGPLDRLIIGLDQALGRATRPVSGSGGPCPGADLDEPVLDEAERRRSEGLMRVDHAGEIAAQALYHAQALVAREDDVRDAMRRAAEEEVDHLAWCERRIAELGGRTSLLGPFWYAGSFAIGAAAGLCGDRWSLGFVAETERQVVRHLEDHLQRLPAGDMKSRAIVTRMRDDESQHATAAVESGGAALPGPVRELMRWCSRVMTGTAYWV
ncbi:MAG TPA: 2-polyprenyl-3-methyl-6-methoxy-1,4-benzoquinone monooxygenase [Gammaproteobacteria bacterium]